jgi:CheY-like chemotaxis protein
MPKSMNVVLIDDDPHTRNLFEMVLGHHQIGIQVYKDAESALKDLPNLSPDVVVIDLFLPGLDGYQMFDRIRSKSLAPRSRFVAITAYYTNDTEQEITKRGFDGYLAKPISADGLVKYLNTLLQ